MFLPKPRRHKLHTESETHPRPHKSKNETIGSEGQSLTPQAAFILPAASSMPHGSYSQESASPASRSEVPLRLSADTREGEGDDPTAPARIRLLVVDDDTLVRETFEEILQSEGYEVVCAESGAQALETLRGQTFDLMLSDIFMPGQNGLELLVETQKLHPEMPVVLITAFGNVNMARQALQNGASDFVTKPCGHDELPIVVERNLTRQAVLYKRAQRTRHEALVLSNETVLDALLSALNTRDTETQGHSERVTAYTIEMAERLGVYASEMYHIERGALLHDIGKIGVPDRILHKPGKLTDEEWVEMRKHPVIGHGLCARIPMLRQASEIVLRHHEAWDGSGYPGGLAGAAIPLGARLFALADTLDAMTSDRPYRPALSFAEARQEVVRFSGKMFDPELVKLFLSIPESRWRDLRAFAHAPDEVAA